MKKIKVKFLVAIASATFSYKPDQEAMIDEKTAIAWEESNVCVILPAEKK